jgi:hypothetical protein
MADILKLLFGGPTPTTEPFEEEEATLGTSLANIIQAPRDLDKMVREWMRKNLFPEISVEKRKPGTSPITVGWTGSSTPSEKAPPTLPTPAAIPPQIAPPPSTTPVPSPVVEPAPSTGASLGATPQDTISSGVPIPAPTEPEVTYPPFVAPEAPKDTDIKAEIQKILSGIPDTVKGVMGRESPDATKSLAGASLFKQLLASGFAGAAGKDIQDMLDKTQTRLDAKFKQDFDLAKAKLGTKTQLEIKNLELKIEQDKEKREHFSKLWAVLGEANPERYMNDPEWWAMGMRAHKVGEPEIRKFVQSHYNPTTGKYEGLYKSKAERDWDSKLFLVNKLTKLLPGYAPDTYMQMVAGGTWPDLVKAKEQQLRLEYPNATPERKAQISKTIYDIEHLKTIVPPDTYMMINKLAKEGKMDPEVAKKVIRTLQLGEFLPAKIVDTIIETESKERQALLARESKAPGAESIKYLNLMTTMSSPVAQVIVGAKPGYRTGLHTGNEKIVTAFNDEVSYISSALEKLRENQTSKKKVPLAKDEIESLSSFYLNQKKYIRSRGYGEVAAKLGGFTADNSLLADYIISKILDGVPPDVLLETITKIRGK